MGRGAALGSSAVYRIQQGNRGWQSRGFITKMNACHSASNGNKSQEFWLDSATNVHFVWNRTLFKDYE